MSEMQRAGERESKRDGSAKRAGIWATWGALLRDGWRTVRKAGAPVLLLMLAFHLAILAIAFPLIGWLFREALRASGMMVLDFAALRIGGGLTVTFALIAAIGVLAFWLGSLQFAVLVLAVRRARLGIALTPRDAMRDIGRIARKLVRPSSLPLVFYLFLVLPLTGFGFTTALARGITLPPFISGELMKSQTTALALTLFFVALLFLSIRWALTVPIFALTDETGGRSMRLSWRLTGRLAAVPLVGAVLTVLLLAGIATIALSVVAILPTALSDELSPDASPLVAALSLGAAQVAGALLTATVTMMLAAILVVMLERRAEGAGIVLRVPPIGSLATGSTGNGRPRKKRTAALLTGIAVVAAIALGIADLPVIQGLARQPDTLVLAHRGFGDGGVENTIGGLEAAARAGADLVEMDVMQTKDGEFVVMHDANLGRLAGKDVAVKDLTLDEITAIEVHDLAGHRDRIPSLRDYVTRAAELEMPLLIEIKLGGADTPDHVDRLVAELESLDALDRNIYHTLDRASVDRLKQLRPDLTVGYIMAFAAIGVPDTPADFVVVEEWSATDEMQRAAREAGLGFLAWTINGEAGMREHLRRGSDGIITDHPDLALALRAEMDEETGLADTLIDSLTRFVVVF